jgi:hypothetical protein
MVQNQKYRPNDDNPISSPNARLSLAIIDPGRDGNGMEKMPIMFPARYTPMTGMKICQCLP